MFVDRARVRAAGGSGGNGCCSFRREKFVPRGGPDGGDGGDGGSVYFVADPQKSSLLDVQFHATWKGNRGAHGQGSGKHGRRGQDLQVGVPPGTVVHDFETGEPLCDLTEPGQRFLAAEGGKGGKGNARFATSTNRTPRFAEKGEPGQDTEYWLELKTMADVGLVGLPNAGKSTLLAHVTAATPKIADYPFTTLSPNLGVASLSDYRAVTIADIPGIIEGASEGKGLGHDFLRHIERTRVLLFLIDLGDEDPAQVVEVLENELTQHSSAFAAKPRAYAFNKADLPANAQRFEAIRKSYPRSFLVSGATGQGLGDLLEFLYGLVERVRQAEMEGRTLEDEEVDREYVYEAPFDITREADGGFRIEGKTVVRAVRMTDFENEEAVRHLHKRLHQLGVLKALKRLGAMEGQPVRIGPVELDYVPD